MKTKKLILTTIAFLVTTSIIFAQEMKTEKFKVYGNCGMCENRIENAALELDGVTKADWNKENNMLEVTFDENKLRLDDLHQTVASVGHDTKKVQAKEEDYNSLPECCQYERK